MITTSLQHPPCIFLSQQPRRTLKHAGPDHLTTLSLSRLLKSELLAGMAELQRPGHYHLSLESLLLVSSDFFDVMDLTFYADMVTALSRYGVGGEIAGLVEDVMVGGQYEKRSVERRGRGRLLEACIGGSVEREGKLMEDLVRG